MSLFVSIHHHMLQGFSCDSQQSCTSSHLNIASINRFSEDKSQSVVRLPTFERGQLWSAHSKTHNYYDYNSIWKWLTLIVCQRAVEWRLHGWLCLWVKTPVNPVCTAANTGGWSETKHSLNSTNQGEYSSSLCTWDVSWVVVGVEVGVFP